VKDIKAAHEFNLTMTEPQLLTWCTITVGTFIRRGEKDPFYSIQGRPVCRPAWMAYWGIKRWKLEQALEHALAGVPAFEPVPRVNEAAKRAWTLAWLAHHLKLDVDQLVSGQLLHYIYWPQVLTDCTKAWVDDPNRPGSCPPSLCMLKSIKHHELKGLHEPKSGHWPRCRQCGQFTAALESTTGSEHAKLLSEYREHRKAHKLERGVMERLVRQVEAAPETGTMVFVDLTNAARIPNVEPTYNVSRVACSLPWGLATGKCCSAGLATSGRARTSS
jgi:hypothetical protein